MSAESWVPVDLYNQLPDFTGRGWAIDRVRAWLDGESGTALLVRGGPGTGKSLLAARLVTSLSDAITYGHFCRFNTADTDPLVFVERLAAALANRYPAALQALTVDPFVSVVVSGTANVGHALPGATVAGTQLGALHIHALAPRLAFNRAVRRAVEAIRTAGITDEIVVLVDALDECGAEPDTIAGLLHDVLDPQARPPDGLRLILTSRPDPRLLHGTDVAVLDLVEDEPESGSDITAYVHRMLDQLPADRRDALAAEVIAVSAGNFLYTRYVVLDLVAGRTDRLPKGLQGVYANFFRRELARSPERWSERYRPLLGLLVVARGNGLTNEWLARSSGLPQSHVDDALRGCAQYLAGPVPDGPVRLYHHSLRDYLLGAGPHQVYPDEAQDALITALLANPCDDYALAHLPEHLAASGRVAELTTLLTDLNFLAAKTARYGIDAILANLRVGGSPNLLRAMERAAHQIRGRDTPGLFVQQVLAAANDLNDTELVNRARTWLADRKLSFVETIWRTGTPSPGLRYVLVPPGEHIMTSEVSVSADWRHVAAAGLRNNIGVWDFDTGIMQWQLDRDVITGALALALSPDGRLLAAGEHVVTVWDTVANHKMWETPKLPSRAKSLAFSSDGVLLLGQVGQKVLVWNSDTGALAYSRTYDRWPSFATFRDRQLIINSDRTFYRYEANTGELIGTVEVTHESEGALLAAADSGGRWVACAWGNCMLDILDFDRTRSWHYALTARAQAVAIGPRDGLTVVTADEQIQVFRPGRKVRNGKLANGARCWHLSVDSSGRYALADANDGVLYEINLGTIDARPRLTGLPSSRVTLAEPDRGQLVRLLAASPGVQVIQYKDIPPTVQLPARSGPVVTLGVSPDGSIGILGLKNRPTEVWNLHHGIEQGTIYAKEPEAIAVNNDIGYVLTASGQWCWVWTLDTRLDRMFRQTRPPVAITSDGLALSVDFDRVIVAWEPTTGRTLRRYTGNTKPVLGLGATSEGAGVISVNRAGQILIWEAEGPPSHSIHVADEPSLTAINADRGLVAVWPDRNGDIALVDISVGAVYRHIPAHLHQATHLTFSGLILVVASGFDEELECWDTSSGRRLAVYPLGSSVQAVAAAADGGILAADLDHNLYWLRVSLPPSTIETPPD